MSLLERPRVRPGNQSQVEDDAAVAERMVWHRSARANESSVGLHRPVQHLRDDDARAPRLDPRPRRRLLALAHRKGRPLHAAALHRRRRRLQSPRHAPARPLLLQSRSAVRYRGLGLLLSTTANAGRVPKRATQLESHIGLS